MKNIIKLAMSAMLALGCVYIAKSQECVTCGNATGASSSSIGSFTQSSGMSSVAIGYDSQSSGDCAVTLGTYLTTSNANALTIGYGWNRNHKLANTTDGIMLGCYSSKPTLYISKSQGHSNATGKVGIGNNTNLRAKLHIKADGMAGYEEDADIMLEPTSSSKKAAIYFKDNNHYISMASSNGIMKFGADKYMFNNGNVAIGNNEVPSAKLHIYGKAGEDANIKLQPTDNAKNAEILFRSTSNKISVGPDNAMNFSSNSFIFNPTGKMEINGTLQVDKSIILKELAGDTAKRLVCASEEGRLSTVNMSSFNDNMGNHVAEKNVCLNGFKLVNIKDDGGIFLDRGNNVGIGTLEPKQMLHVVGGNILITRVSSKNTEAPGSANGSVLFGDVASGQYPFGAWGIEYLNDDEFGHGLNFWKTYDSGGEAINHVLFLCDEGDYKGNVGIGTPRPLHKLSVNGTVLARELIVSKLDEDWPDYVFDPEYSLTNLEELGSYVRSERHLPGVPSAKEMEESGVKVGEMNAILLQKVEELTLYVIELQRQINELKGESK